MARRTTSDQPGYQYTCARCGIAFRHQNKGRQFCSRECHAASMRHQVEQLSCVVCGAPRTNHRDLAPSLYARFETCSRACGHVLAARRFRENATIPRVQGLPPRPCKRCGREFIPTNRSNEGIYCSNACHLATLHGRGRKTASK